MKLTYHRSGDYLLPNLAVPDAPISLGKYGRMHAAYLKEHKPILYNNLLLSGKLTKHLAEVDSACQEYLETLLPQMMQQEGVDEALKACDQLEWVRRMNSIQNRAEELLLDAWREKVVMQPLSCLHGQSDSLGYGARLPFQCVLAG